MTPFSWDRQITRDPVPKNWKWAMTPFSWDRQIRCDPVPKNWKWAMTPFSWDRQIRRDPVPKNWIWAMTPLCWHRQMSGDPVRKIWKWGMIPYTPLPQWPGESFFNVIFGYLRGVLWHKREYRSFNYTEHGQSSFSGCTDPRKKVRNQLNADFLSFIVFYFLKYCFH